MPLQKEIEGPGDAVPVVGRGDAVHRREQARFFLDVDPNPGAALAAAEENWQVQREPDDALILLRAAQAAGQSPAAQPARQFLQQAHLQDVRMAARVPDTGALTQ